LWCEVTRESSLRSHELKPKVDRLWAEKLHDGTWRAWIEKYLLDLGGRPRLVRLVRVTA
jgi:hypothetical protein